MMRVGLAVAANSPSEKQVRRKSGLSRPSSGGSMRRFISDDGSLELLLEGVIRGIRPEEERRIKQFFQTAVKTYLQFLLDCEESRLTVSELSQGDEGVVRQFGARTDAVFREGEALLAKVQSSVVRKRIKAAFRDILSPWMARNPFVRRCLEKPRGYPGDYMMMELGYEPRIEFSAGLGDVFDRYFLSQYASVLYRKDKLKSYIRELLMNSSSSSSRSVRIISLGGGPAREWIELEEEEGLRAATARVRLTYLDQDEEAIDFARMRLKGNSLIHVTDFRQENLFSFSRSKNWIREEATYDLAYGLGIADYFYDRVLAGVIGRAFRLLKKGGKLILTHKDALRFKFLPADWLCDWSFVRRGEREFSVLVSNALSSSGIPFKLNIERERTKEILFAVGTRLAS